MDRLQSAEEIDAVIAGLLREVIPWQFEKVEIRPEMSLQRELGIDSLGKMAVAFRMEEELGVDLSLFSGTVAEIETVADLLRTAGDLVRRSRGG